MKKFILFTLFFLGQALAQASDPCYFVFFDLGAGSLIETPEPFPKTIFFVHGKGANSDAPRHLKYLNKLGHKTGLLVNFPDKYNDQDFTTIDTNPNDRFKPNRQAAKIDFIKKIIQTGWKDPKTKMNEASWAKFWSYFGDRFLVTPTDEDRKNRSPFLFEEAQKRAQAEGCKAIYESKIKEEIDFLENTAKDLVYPFLEGSLGPSQFYLDPNDYTQFVFGGE